MYLAFVKKDRFIVVVKRRSGDCNGHTEDLKYNETGVRLQEEPDALSVVN